MILLVGLGNPGAKYARHRHNVGFLAVEEIARAVGAGPWRSKFEGELAIGELGDDKALVLKPQTFMNDSGRSVGAAMRFYKLEPSDIVVFHDELDLAPGKIRIKTGGGVAGHNGLRSISAHIGPDFRRVRIGIGHPGDKSRVHGHVLGDFAKPDEVWLRPALDALAAEAPKLLEGDAAYSAAVGARLAPPPKPKPKPSPAPDPESGAASTPETPEKGTALGDALKKILDS
ncbi:MAG: aminoacyl-tRNA hydrolase [Pseudomonadota bacterium]